MALRRASPELFAEAGAVLYSTIWLALVFFVVAQYLQGTLASAHGSARWILWTNAIGLALCVLHIAIAMASVYGWSHAAAADATASRTAAVYGWRWGGGLYVNYLFVAVWAGDTWWYSRADRRLAHARWLRRTLRIFYAIVIFNAAVVFARGPMRIFGAALVAALLLAWKGRRP